MVNNGLSIVVDCTRQHSTHLDRWKYCAKWWETRENEGLWRRWFLQIMYILISQTERENRENEERQRQECVDTLRYCHIARYQCRIVSDTHWFRTVLSIACCSFAGFCSGWLSWNANYTNYVSYNFPVKMFHFSLSNRRFSFSKLFQMIKLVLLSIALGTVASFGAHKEWVSAKFRVFHLFLEFDLTKKNPLQ